MSAAVQIMSKWKKTNWQKIEINTSQRIPMLANIEDKSIHVEIDKILLNDFIC